VAGFISICNGPLGPIKAMDFFTDRLTISFLRRTLLHSVWIFLYKQRPVLSTTTDILLKELGDVKKLLTFVGFEVFTAVTMKNAVFRDMAPCEYCKNRRFGGTCRLHLQGRRYNAIEEKC
jgi:hypothetical protein